MSQVLSICYRVVSEQDERFEYYADVGVNAYVTVQLSFLPEPERRSTRVVARTFCPDFDYHMEVPCDLQVQRSSGETCSLAEQLEEASVVFTVWNRDSRKGLQFKIHSVIALCNSDTICHHLKHLIFCVCSFKDRVICHN